MTAIAPSVEQRAWPNLNSMWKAAIIGLLTLLMAACSTVVPRTEGPSTPGPQTEELPDSTVLPKDADRHRVAILVPLTGSNAAVGESIANAANMAVLDTGGTAVRVTSYDTATGAAAAAERAIADGNELILGPLLSEDVVVVAPIARARKVPVISFSNDVSVAGNGVFIMGFTPSQSVDRVVSYAAAQGHKRFGLMAPTGLYGQRATAAYNNAVRANGGTIVASELYDLAPISINGASRRLAEKSPYDAILIADSGKNGIMVAGALQKASIGSPMYMGTELWDNERTLIASPNLFGAIYATASDALYDQLAAKYRSRFGKAPYRLASLGYDSVLLVTKISRDWRVGKVFPEKSLRDPGGFTGIDGAFRFGGDNIAQRALQVDRVDKGKITTIDAAPTGFIAK